MPYFYDGECEIVNEEEEKMRILFAYKHRGLYLNCACTRDNLLLEILDNIMKDMLKTENKIYAFNGNSDEVFNYSELNNEQLMILLKKLNYPDSIDIKKIRYCNKYCKQFINKFNAFTSLLALNEE